MHAATLNPCGEKWCDDVNVSVQGHGLATGGAARPGDKIKQVAPVCVSLFRRKALRPLRSLGEMQQRVVRVRLDARVDGPAFEARAAKSQAAQLAFKDAKATTLGRPHSRNLRFGRGVNLA